MSDATDRHRLPYLASAQAQKHVTVNEALRALDALVQPSVRSATVAEEPAAPAPGEAYILPANTTGAAWTGLAGGTLAAFQDGAWAGFAPVTGLTAYVEDEGVHRVFDGAAWVPIAAGEGGAPGGPSEPQTSAPFFGINASADETNRLAVASAAVLHTHDASGDARHVLNKAAAGGTASFVFQTGFSGRAEIGLTGSDDFAFKVSPDGQAFREAIVIDRTDGSVRFPNTELPTGTGAGDGSSAPGGGVTVAEVARTAEAFAGGLRASLVATGGVEGGNLALTRQIVLSSAAGKVQIASAEDGNVVEAYASGADLAAGVVRHRLFLKRGEVRVLEGLPAGAVIASTKGLAGVSDTGFGPCPLAPGGFAAKRFFAYAFRDSANGRGLVYAVAGAVSAKVKLMSGDGTRTVAEADLPAFGLAALPTDADAEFQIVADQPISCGIAASDGGSDVRLVPPLDTELIGWGQQGWVSALYPDTNVRWHARNGQSGAFSVSPGAPVRMGNAGVPQLGNYAADGCVILRADGPISAFSGADFAGSDATPFYPLSALGQRVPLPLAVASAPSGGAQNGIAVASPYAGTARIYATDGSLVEILALTRQGAVSSPDDQLRPCVANAAPGGFAGGYVEADVPIYVVQNSNGNEAIVQGGVLGGAKETVMPGVTPEELRTAVRRDAMRWWVKTTSPRR